MQRTSFGKMIWVFGFIFFIVHAGLAPKAEAGSTLIVTPDKGAPGTKLVIKGAGFLPEENVKVIFYAGALQLQLAAADSGGITTVGSDGAFTLEASGGIPIAATFVKPGIYIVGAAGDKGSYAATILEVLKKK